MELFNVIVYLFALIGFSFGVVRMWELIFGKDKNKYPNKFSGRYYVLQRGAAFELRHNYWNGSKVIDEGKGTWTNENEVKKHCDFMNS